MKSGSWIQERINDPACDIVIIPGGEYEIEAPIVVPFAKQGTPDNPPRTVELVGCGVSQTIIRPSERFPIGQPLLRIERSYTKVADLQLHGRRGDDSWHDVVGIDLPGGPSDLDALRRVIIDNVVVRDTRHGMLIGRSGVTILLAVIDCQFSVSTLQILKVHKGTTLRFVRTSFKEFGIGCELFNAHGCSFESCHWEGNRGTNPSLMLRGCSATSVRGAWFEESHRPSDNSSPWFAWVDGCIATLMNGTFVRKNPKLRVALVGPTAHSEGTVIEGVCRVVGPWDHDAPVWSMRGSTPWIAPSCALVVDDVGGVHPALVKTL